MVYKLYIVEGIGLWCEGVGLWCEGVGLWCEGVWLWCITPLPAIFQLWRVVSVSFIGGGNRSTRIKQLTWRKSMTTLYCWNVQFFSNVHLKKCEVLLPQTQVTLADFSYHGLYYTCSQPSFDYSTNYIPVRYLRFHSNIKKKTLWKIKF